MRKLILIVAVVGCTAAAVFLYRCHLVRQVRFNLIVLADYLNAYHFLHPEPLKDFSQMPEFDIISPSESLGIKGADLRSGRLQGYKYALHWTNKNEYFITAAPDGILTPAVEYAVTNAGELKMKAGGGGDTIEEIKTWPAVENRENYRTRELPGYLQ